MGLWDFVIDHFIHNSRLQCVHDNPGSFHCLSQSISISMCYQILKVSQEQQIALVPIPTIYEDEQEMLNGNGRSAIVPHPQPGVPDI